MSRPAVDAVLGLEEGEGRLLATSLERENLLADTINGAETGHLPCPLL